MPREVRVLSGTDLSKILTLNEVIPAIEAAYLAASRQQAVLYPVIPRTAARIGRRLRHQVRVLAREGVSWPQSGWLLAAQPPEGHG